MTRFIALASVLAFCATGCACPPGREARRLAGSQATHCGFASADDISAVTECLDAAIAAERAAYGGWELVGRDSGLKQYFVVRRDRTYDLDYDGSQDRLTITPCMGAPVYVDGAYTCDGELLDSYEFCD